MLQNISEDGVALCDCQKAFGSYSTISNEMDNDGIHTSQHFKFEWKFEQHSAIELPLSHTIYTCKYLPKKQPSFTASFIKDIFRPPGFYFLHKAA